MTSLNLTALSSIATGGLFAAVWQGALLSLVVALTLRLLPKTPAAVRFAIWFGVFAVVAILPVAGLLRTAAPAAQHPAWLTLDARWCLVVAGAWAMASLMRAVTLVLAAFRVRSLWKRATPLDLHSASPSAPRRAELCSSEEVDRPTVIGFFAPKILIPSWLVEKLTAAELEQILLHESGHLNRADDWMNLLQKVALVIFPLNPALAWVERRLCFERELACDEHVLRTTGAPKAYAECLANLAEHRLARTGRLALALGALGHESELGRRVGRILRRGELMRPAHARFVLGGAMLALLTAAAGLEHCPQVVGFAPAADANHATLARPAIDLRNSRYTIQQVAFRVPESRVDAPARIAVKASPSRAIEHPYRLRVASFAASSSRTAQPRAINVSQSIPSASSSPASGQTNAPTNTPVVQWFVVTSWQRADGARLVMTSEQISTAPNQVVRMQSVTQSDSAPDQVQPYAAVPVRGGWLIFQL